MRIPARHLTCVAPARTEGLLALCALDPVGGVCLAQQVGRWRSWNDGDVVALGRSSGRAEPGCGYARPAPPLPRRPQLCGA